MNPSTNQSDDHAHDPARSLAEDLSCVFGEAPLRPNVKPAAFARGKPIAWQEAVSHAAKLIAQSQRTAWVGLHPLTIESLRAVVTLAEQHRGCLLPRPHFDSPLRLTQPITQLGTMGHLMSCDLILGIGIKRSELPAKLQQSIKTFEALPDNLQTIIDLSTAMHQSLNQKTDAQNKVVHPFVKIIQHHHSIGVVLAPESDERVVSQWHKLAAAMQQQTRMAIMELPHFEALNARGVEAVIAWRTACSIATGGVDFSSGQPLPCSGWRNMLAQADDLDLIIDTSLYPLETSTITTSQPSSDRPAIIRIASAPSSDATISFVTPDIAPGMAGRVMRFDGLILRLAGQNHHPLPDLTTELLGELLAAMPAAPAAQVQP